MKKVLIFSILVFSHLHSMTPCKILMKEFIGENQLSDGKIILNRVQNPNEPNSHEQAIEWIVNQAQSFGLTPKLQVFHKKINYIKSRKLFPNDHDFTKNVKFTNIIVNIPSKIQKNKFIDNEKIIIGAHYDAPSSKLHSWFGNKTFKKIQSADDNGSGVIGLVHLMNKFKDHSLPYDLQFMFFDGEELGKIGSDYYVETSSDLELSYVKGVIILDMIGYNSEVNPNVYNLSTFGVDHSALRKELVKENDLFPILNTNELTSSYFILPLSDGSAFYERGVPVVMLCDCINITLLKTDHPLHTEKDNINIIDWKYFGKMLQNIERTLHFMSENPKI